VLVVSLAIAIHQNSTNSILDFWYPETCYLLQEVLVYYFLFVFSVLYTKMQISKYIQPFDSFPRSEWKMWYLTAISTSIMNLLHWKTELGFFILRSVLMFFLPVFTTVATCFPFAQVFCLPALGLLRHLSSRMLTVLFLSCWLHILGQGECPLLVLTEPQTLAYLSNNISADPTLAWPMWWFWLKFLFKTDKTVSSNFSPLAVRIFILKK